MNESEIHERHPQLARLQTTGLIVGVVAAVVAVLFGLADATRFFQSYLVGYLYWLALSLGCLGWLMIFHLTNGNWAFTARRVWEAGARTIPLMAVLLLPILFGMEPIFPWTRPEAAGDPIIQGKSGYLNVPFFILRAIIYFVIWSAFALLLTRWSYREDREEVSYRRPMQYLSGVGLVVMALTVTFYSIDWAMSVDPHWFSTIFGFLFAASDLLAAMALGIVMVKLLERREPLKTVLRIGHYHDLGNMLMAFVMLWAYMSFSQFLIIWSGNTQEEAPWYVERMSTGWVVISLILVVFHFALPFLILLTRRTKRAPNVLVKIAFYMLIMRFVDLYWLIMPSFAHGEGIHFHLLDLLVPAAMGGFWLALFASQLKDRPLVSLKDPRLLEAVHGTGGHH